MTAGELSEAVLRAQINRLVEEGRVHEKGESALNEPLYSLPD